jgi:hypothetical protein
MQAASRRLCGDARDEGHCARQLGQHHRGLSGGVGKIPRLSPVKQLARPLTLRNNPGNNKQRTTRVADKGNESDYKAVSNFNVDTATEDSDFYLLLELEDGSVTRARFSPRQACDLLAWFPVASMEREDRVKSAEPRLTAFAPIPIGSLSGELAPSPKAALIYANAGILTLALKVDFGSLRILQDWIRKVIGDYEPPPSPGETQH